MADGYCASRRIGNSKAAIVFSVCILFLMSSAISQDEDVHLDGFETSPAIVSAPLTEVAEENRYLYQVEISNPDQFPVQFFLETAPAGMVVDSEHGLVEWPVPLLGVHRIEIVAVDSRGRLDIQIYDLSVVPNTIQIVSEPESQAMLNSLFQYQVEVAGETEGVQYSLSVAPDEMTIDAATGLTRWITAAEGTFPVSLSARNAQGHSGVQSFDLEVLARDPGDAVLGQLAGLHSGKLVIRELNSDQYFALSDDGAFSIGPFETQQPYLFEIADLSTSTQNCVLSNDQGVLPQEVDEGLIIQCAAGDAAAEALLESIELLEESGELTPIEDILSGEFAESQQSESRSREIDRAHALVLAAEDPDPDWMGTRIDGDQVVITSPGSVHTVSASKFNADGDIIGAVDTSKLRFEIRLQRSADEIQWVPRELAEDMVFWTGNPGEFQVQVPSDLGHGRLIVGLRPDFEDPGARAIAERWSQAILFEIWPVRPGVIKLDPSSVLFPKSGETPMAPGSAFSIQELEQRVDGEFLNDNLVMPLVVESASSPDVGDLVDYQWNGDPFGGRIVHAESRSGQTLLLLSPEWNAVYDVMDVEENFLEKHGVLPSVIAYRIGDEIIPGFDAQHRDPIESLQADAGLRGAQPKSGAGSSGSRSSRSAARDLFIRTCDSPTSRPIVAVSNKFKLSPPEASVSLTVATGERANILDIDCSWQANPDKRFAMPLVVAGPAGVIAQKLFGTEVGVRPTGKVILNARADVSALLAFKASFSTRDGLKTNMPELPRTTLAFDSLDGPPIEVSNRIGSDLGVVFFANALSTRGILGKLARLFSRDEIEVGVEASVSLGIGVGFSGANAAAVYQGATSGIFTDLEFCAKVGISASLLKILRAIVGSASVDVELFCRTFKATIGPEAPFTFDQIQDDFEGNAVATGLSGGSVFELVFGSNVSGIVAPSNRNRFESIFDDRHDAISYDLAECPDRSSASGASGGRISGDLIVCAHSLVCGKADKPVELCGTGLSVSPVTASGLTGEQVSAEGTIKALSARGLLEAIEVTVSGDPMSPQVSPQQPLMLSSSRPERTLSFESVCESQGVTRGQSQIQTLVENIEPGSASNVRVCRCDPGERDCDRIWGSPHLLTADGLALDYYASGDYVLARVDGQRPIEVQGRFLPGHDASWPQAVALQVGPDVVEIHTDTLDAAFRVSHRLRIWVNGTEPVEPGAWQPFRNTRALRLPGGGLIVLEAVVDRFLGELSDPSRVLVLMPEDHEYPDFGVRVQSLIFDQSEQLDFADVPPILSVSILRGESVLGRDSGLLGTANGNENDDMTLSGGSIIPFSDNLTWTELYAQFGASWLVRPYECLFRNGCLDPQFPKLPAVLDPGRRQFAEAACFGLEGWYREACIHDVGLSGSAELVQGLYRNVEDLNFMADRIERPGADFPFLTLTAGAAEAVDSYELHHFTVERVEGQGPFMLTVRPPKGTTAVLHSTGDGTLTGDGDLLVDAVRLSCIPDPEWSEIGAAWPIEGRLELWAVDPISGTAETRLGAMPLAAERLNEYCTGIRFDLDSEFLSDAVLRVENTDDQQRYVQLQPEPWTDIAAPALETIAICPGCDVQLDLGLQCHGGLQKLGMMQVTDAAGKLLESREVVCATPAGTAFPRISLDKVFQATENAMYIAPDDRIWDLVKEQNLHVNLPEPDLYWMGKPTPMADDAFGGSRIVQIVPGGDGAGSERTGHFLALDENGRVWAWGHNFHGELGIPSCALGDENGCRPGMTNNDSDRHDTPVMLEFDRLPATIKQIAAGQEFSLALDTDGNVWSWGGNWRFALGRGGDERDHRSTPGKISSFGALISPPPIDLVATGGSSTGLARAEDGRLFAWGANFNGALGTGSGQNSERFPDQVVFPDPAGTPVAVFPGPSGSLAIDDLGQLWGWGRNNRGQVTHLDSRNSINEPVRIVSQGGASRRYQWAMRSSSASYAMDFYGRLWAWGGNSRGGLGQGDFEEREGHFPVDLSRLGGSAVIAADTSGNGGVMIEDSSRRVWGWGMGSLMPNGFRSHEPLPVLIQDRPDGRPDVKVSSLAGGEWLFHGSARLETIAVIEAFDQARRTQESRRISISTNGLVFALSGSNELDLPRGRKVRDAILADAREICARPGLVTVELDILDENGEALARHEVEVTCQYPVQFELGKGLGQSRIQVRNDWEENLEIVISAVDGLTLEPVEDYPLTICAACETEVAIHQVCPVVGRHLLARIEINSEEDPFSELRKLDCGRSNSLIHAVEGATFITDHLGTPWAWGSKIRLGLGESGQALPEIVEQPVELVRDEGFGGGLGSSTANIAEFNAVGRAVQSRDLDGHLWVWGSAPSGETGTGIHSLTHDIDDTRLPTPQPVGGALADAWIALFHPASPIAHDRRGRVWQWASNRWGENGNRVASDQVWPTPVDLSLPMSVFSKLARDSTLAIGSDGWEVWAWGDVPHWMAGEQINSNSEPCNLVQNGPNGCMPFLLSEDGLDGHPIRDVVVARDVAMFLDSLGRVWQWGRIDTSTTILDQPERLDLAPLGGARVVGIGISQEDNSRPPAFFVQDENGHIWARGTNSNFVLGTGNSETAFEEAFQRVAFPDNAGRILEIAATADYVLALDENHCFWAWGRDFNGTGPASPFLGSPFQFWMPVSALHQFSSPGCPVSTPPVIVSEPAREASTAEPYFYQVEVFNQDGFPIEFSLNEFPDGLAVDAQTGLITWQMPTTGLYSIEAQVTDSRGHRDTQWFALHVSEPD